MFRSVLIRGLSLKAAADLVEELVDSLACVRPVAAELHVTWPGFLLVFSDKRGGTLISGELVALCS